MQWQFEYLLGNIDPALIRDVAKLDDESLTLTMAGVICQLVGGLKSFPSKKYRSSLAREMIARGMRAKKVLELTGVSERTYFNLKKEMKNGKEK
nr:MAG TPA: Flagellar transcriptional activator (FlhC) [Caudoviricetes sp.]